jgi:hypothetical protein
VDSVQCKSDWSCHCESPVPCSECFLIKNSFKERLSSKYNICTSLGTHLIHFFFLYRNHTFPFPWLSQLLVENMEF